MATQLEISTVSAVKSVQTLRQQTAALTGVIKGLAKEIGTLQGKMKGAAVDSLTKKLAAQSMQIAKLATRVKNTANMAQIFAKAQKKAETEVTKLNAKLAKAAEVATKLAAKQKAGATATKKVSTESTKAAAATLKMKSAAAAASQQFQTLTQKLKLTGAANVNIANLRRSFEALDKKLKAGKLTPIQYANAINRWKASMGTARRELVKLKDAEQKQTAAAKAAAAAARKLTPVIRRLGVRTRRTQRDVSGLSKRMKILGSSAIFAVGPLSGIGARVAAFGAISSKAGVRIALFSLGVAALVIGAIKLVKAMLGVNVEMTRIKNALKVATGGAEAANREFDFLVQTAEKLALNLPAVSLQFAQLSAAATGTRLAGAGVRDIFEAMSKASLVLSLSAEQTQGAFRALQQMISKGTVQAEELRGQLGERLPGAFQIAARAMGVTTRELGKLMEQGLIRATDLIPKMTEELNKMFDPSVVDAIDSWTAASNRLSTAWFLFLDELDKKIQSSKGLQIFIEKITKVVELMEKDLSGELLFSTRMNEIDESIKSVTASLRPLEIAFASSTKFVTAQRFELAKLRGELTALLRDKSALQQTDTSGPLQNEPFQPPLSNQAFLDLPVTSVNRFQDSLVDLRKVMGVLGDESIDLNKRLDMRDSLNRTAAAVKSVNKVMKGLSENEQFALRLQFTPAGKGVLTLEQLRGVILKLIIDEANLQNAVKDATTELRAQAKAAERLGVKFSEIKLELETVENKLESAFSGDFVEKQFVQSLDKARKMLLKFSDESVAIFARTSGLISQQSFDNFISAEGLARAQAFAEILGVVEQEFGSILRSTNDAESMAQVFADTRTETELLNTEMERLNHLLERFGDSPEKVEAIKRAMADLDPFLNAISEGIQRMGSDLAGAIRSGENLFDTLKNSFANLLETLLDLAIQLLIIKPLLGSLGLPGGSASPATLLGFGTNLLGLPSKKGNAFSGGNVVPFRKGGIVSSPSNFSFGNNIGSVAEAGPEGILPLKRTSSGNLGVEAVGAGGGTTVNFFLAPGESVREFNESQPEIAAMIQGTMSSAAASNG